MKKILIFILSANILFAVPCKETIKYLGWADDTYQFQEINLDCTDGYKFRVLTEAYSKKILEIEDNKYLKKGTENENKKD